MNSNSRLETSELSSGRRYKAIHKVIQTDPSAPVVMNAIRQPNRSEIHLTSRGVRIAPTFVPELNIPVANARSFFGNHSATAFTDAGKLPASPMPKLNRAASN